MWVKLSDRLALNLKVWAIVATVAWGITTALYLSEVYLDPRNDFADGGAEGPFKAHIASYTNEAKPVFVLDGPADSIEAGQVVGWLSHLCIEKGLFLLTRPDVAALDGKVIARGRERLWTPEDARCGEAVGGLVVPADTEPGIYELRRWAWAHPLGWFPQRAKMEGLRFRVVQATKANP